MFKHFTRRKNAKYHFILSISFIVIISLVVAMVTFFSSSSSSSSCSSPEQKEGFDLGIFSTSNSSNSNSGSTGRDDSDSSSSDEDYSLSPSSPSSSSTNTFYFFSASWCPHCTSAKGAWSDLLAKCDASGSYTTTTTSAAKVLCSNVDCSDVDPNSRTNQLMQIYNVQFFPKFILDASG